MVATAASAVPAWIPRTCPAALKSTGMTFEDEPERAIPEPMRGLDGRAVRQVDGAPVGHRALREQAEEGEDAEAEEHAARSGEDGAGARVGGIRRHEPAERAAHRQEGDHGAHDHVAGGRDAEPDGEARERGARQPAQAEEPVERRHDRTPVLPLDQHRLGVHGNVEWMGALCDLARTHGCEVVLQLGDFGFWPHYPGGVRFLAMTPF